MQPQVSQVKSKLGFEHNSLWAKINVCYIKER